MSRNERRHPQIEDAKLSLSAEEEGALLSLRSTLGPMATEIIDSALVRFLRYQSWDVEAAATAWREYIQWRTENKLDDILSTKVPNKELLDKVIPYAYHGMDVDGRPIYWEKTGKILCDIMSDTQRISADDLNQSHIWGMEYLFDLAFQRGVATGKRVDSICTVLDMNGLGLHHRSVLFCLKACLDIDNKYYPERVGKLYVLNTPWIAPTLYGLVQPLLPTYLKERVNIVQGNPNEFLKSVIPPQHIPVEYGGECVCGNKPGGCLPEHTLESVGATGGSAVSDGLDVELISYEFTRALECDEKGATFTWFFQCENEYDIDFSVAIHDLADKSKAVVWAKQQTRCITHKGSYTATGPTRLVFHWDNNFSYFNSKTIRYSISSVNLGDLNGKLSVQ